MKYNIFITSHYSEERKDLHSLSFQPAQFLTLYPITPKPEPPKPSLHLSPYPIPPQPEPPKPSLHLSPYPIPPQPEPPKPSLHLSPYPIPYPAPDPDGKNGFYSLLTDIFKKYLSFLIDSRERNSIRKYYFVTRYLQSSLGLLKASFLIYLKERNSIREYPFVSISYIFCKTELYSQMSVRHYFVNLNLQKLVYASLLGSLNKATSEHSESAYDRLDRLDRLYDLKQNSLGLYYDNNKSKTDRFKKYLSYLIDSRERNSIREYLFLSISSIFCKTELHSQMSVRRYFVKLNLQKLVYASLLGSLNKATSEHSESAYDRLYDLKQNSLELYYDNDQSETDSFLRINDLLNKILYTNEHSESAYDRLYESLNEIDSKQNSLELYYYNDQSETDSFDLLNKILYNSAHAWFYESLNEIDLTQSSLGLKLYKDICDLLFSVLNDIEHRLVSIESNNQTCLIFDTTFECSKKQTISKIEFISKDQLNNLLINNYSKKKCERIVSADVLNSLLSNQTGSLDLYRLCKILMVDQLRFSVQIKCDKICNEGGVKEFKLLSYEESGIINFNICIALTMPPKANKTFYPIPQKSCLLRVN